MKKKIIFCNLKVTEEPDPLVRGTDPRIRTKISRIRNTAYIGTSVELFRLQDPSNCFVISSDFCHWGQRFRHVLLINSSFRNLKLRSLFNDCFYSTLYL
jgi:hypothetical protein